MANPFDLTGKVAIVTGSSRGIGRAIALALAGAGAKTVVSSRKEPACESVAQEIRAAGGVALVQTCNIARREEVDRLVDATLQSFGRVDVLVCNAAVNPVFGSLQGLTDDAFDKIMGANVKSNLWLCNRVIPGMAERGGGSIVIVSSIAGLRGTPVIGAYGMSKAADMALARNLAVEWGPRNVRANCLVPGLVRTDFARALWDDPQALAARSAETPLRRIGEPGEIAPAALFLASEASSFMTGQTIVIDGGVTIAG